MEKILNQMARMVIGLHEEGYKDDFERYGKDQLWGVQENRPYAFDEININKICPIKDQNGKSGKIILAIETVDGCKGLFIETYLYEQFLKEVSINQMPYQNFMAFEDLAFAKLLKVRS